MTIKVKLCGFTNKETVDFACIYKPDFLGFVFCKKSIRNTTPKEAGIISKDITDKVKKVAVVVNPDNDQLDSIVSDLEPNFIQLHGDETPQRVQEIKNIYKIPIIKAVSIKTNQSLIEINQFEEIIDFFLFDSHIAGSGKTFNWKILKNLEINKKWFLSGGLNINNIDEALKNTNAQMIDLSSGIEENKGQKSKKLIAELMEKIKTISDI